MQLHIYAVYLYAVLNSHYNMEYGKVFYLTGQFNSNRHAGLDYIALFGGCCIQMILIGGEKWAQTIVRDVFPILEVNPIIKRALVKRVKN